MRARPVLGVSDLLLPFSTTQRQALPAAAGQQRRSPLESLVSERPLELRGVADFLNYIVWKWLPEEAAIQGMTLIGSCAKTRKQGMGRDDGVMRAIRVGAVA